MKKPSGVLYLLTAIFFLFGCSSSNNPPPPQPTTKTLGFAISTVAPVVYTGLEISVAPRMPFYITIDMTDEMELYDFDLQGTYTERAGATDFALVSASMDVVANLNAVFMWNTRYAWEMDPDDPIVWTAFSNPTAGSYTLDFESYLPSLVMPIPTNTTVIMYPHEVDVQVGEDEVTWSWSDFEDYAALADQTDRDEDIYAAVANDTRSVLIDLLGSVVAEAFDTIEANAAELADGEVVIACDPLFAPAIGPTLESVLRDSQVVVRAIPTGYSLDFTCFKSDEDPDTGVFMWGTLELEEYAVSGEENVFHRSAAVTWTDRVEVTSLGLGAFIFESISDGEVDSLLQILGSYQMTFFDPETDR